MAPDIDELTRRLRAFAAERDWDRFHDPKNLAMLLASEVGELVAEFRWLTPEEARAVGRDDASLERVTREIGDVGIALLRICDKLGISLGNAVADKIEYNAGRYPALASRGKAEPPHDSGEEVRSRGAPK